MHSETTESTWFYELLAWIEFNRSRVIAGAIAVLAVIVAIYVYAWHREQTELAASRALLALRLSPQNAQNQPAASPADLLKVATEYGSTSAGERALLLAAGSLFADGKYAEAQTEFDRFSREHGGSPLAPIAALGNAASLDALDKVDAALAAYQAVANQYPNDPAAVRARLAMASLHEARSQPDQAYRIYDEISKQPGVGGAVMEAAMRKERLLQKHPGLASTNLPPTAPATTVKAAPGASTPAPTGTKPTPGEPPVPGKK